MLSNSFHATVFSLIFHTDFLVMSRKEELNSRMVDLLERVNLQERFVHSTVQAGNYKKIDWDAVDLILEKERIFSRQYLSEVVSGAE